MRTALSSLAIVATLLTACSGIDDSKQPAGLPSRPGPTSAADSPLRLERAASVATGSSYVGSLAFADDVAAFAYAADPDHGYADSIGVWRTAESRIRTLAATDYPHGTLGGVAIQDGVVVFVDISQIASTDSHDLLTWQVRSVNLDGSDSRVLASSPRAGTVTAPLVQAGDGRFAWTTWEDDADPFAGRRVYEWAPGDGRPEITARGVWLNDSATPVRGGLLYTETQRDGRWPSGMYKTDLYFLPAEGGEPTNISQSGLVLEYAANKGGVAWTETNPKTRTTGKRTDPFTTYFRRIHATERATQLATGYTSGNLTGGDGWLAWWSANLDVVVSSDSVASPVELDTTKTFVPTRPSGDEDGLVVGESSNGRVTLTLVTVSA